MRLKSVELIGFKSFAKKTKISFPNGITEIVGPNGSGKSNIIEAIRWALGEQSAKNLRSTRMTDVIFSGSQSHPALNRAKVTLNFDNRDHFIHTNYDELTVARTVYRDGTNNYYLNNKPCRLRDIQDLFMNTGIGDGSFSIISQGKVSQIFKSKPVDRRFIIETVAGIYKYRAQKELASQKLNRVNVNLDRLQDLDYELNERRQGLGRERQTALRYLKQKRLAERLDTVRLMTRAYLLRQKRARMNNHYDGLKGRLDRIHKRITQYEKRDRRLKARIDRYSGHYNRLQGLILKESHRLDSLSNQTALYQQRTGFWRNQIESDRKALYRNKKSGRSLRTRLTRLKSIVEVTDQKIKQLTDQSQRLRNAKEVDGVRKDRNRVDQLRKAYVQLVKRSAVINGRIVNHHRNVREHRVDLRRIKSQLSDVSDLNTKVTRQIKDIDHRLPAAKRDVNRTSQQVAWLNDQKRQLGLRISGLQKGHRLTVRQKQTLLIRTAGLKRIQSRHSNLNYGGRNLMSHENRFAGILGPVAQFIKVPDKYVRAIETTLRSQLQQIIVSNSDVARQIINFMTSRRLGRVTLLPVNDLSKRWIDSRSLQTCRRCSGFIDVAANLVRMSAKFKNVKDHLLGNVLITKDITAAIEVSRSIHRRYRVVTLDGNVVNAGGAITGGHGRYQYHGILSQRAKLDQYRTDLSELKRENQRQVRQLSRLQAQYDQINQQLGQRRDQLSQVHQKLLLKTNLKHRLIDEAGNYQRLFKKRKLLVENDSRANPTLSLTNLRRVQAKLKTKVAQNRHELDVVRQDLGQRIHSNSRYVAEYQAARESLIEIRGQGKQQRIKMTALTDKLKRLNDDDERCRRSVARLRHRISQQRSASKGNRNLDQFHAKLRQLNDKKLSCQKLINENQKTRSAIESGLSSDRDRLVAVRNRLNRAYLNRNEIVRKQREVAETLIRRYRIDPNDRRKGLSKPKASLYQVSSKLLKVQERLRKLGSVDVNSIARFKKVNHRYQFMSGQISDLFKSKHQLITTMSQMNSKIGSRFKTTFDEVNRAFKITYAQIFRGGKAKLKLIDPKHLLTTGIDIMAQPPGKRYRNMELLSGGERALTAIALLFAILRIKPAPFCILDEAESALDAINIDRFGDYMQKLKAKTQFIVITHRKTTMLYADHLYGVTMQNSGISKIISVNLKKAKAEG